MTLMAPFLTEAECVQLMKEAPDLVPLLIDNIGRAQKFDDHVYSIEGLSNKAGTLFQYADSMAASSSLAIDKMVDAGLLERIGCTLQTEPDRFPQEVRWSLSCLCRVLQREEGEETAHTQGAKEVFAGEKIKKHEKKVREKSEIMKGIGNRGIFQFVL